MKEIRIPRFRSEQFFSLFLILFWGQDTVFNYIRAIILRIPYVNIGADYYFPIAIFVCFVLSLPYVVKAVSPKDLLFLLISAIFYFLQTLLFPENREYLMSIAVNFFTVVLPLYIVGLRMDSEKHFKILYISSLVNICAFSLYTLFSSDSNDSHQVLYSGFMSRAYILLPQLLVAIGYAFKKPNWINITIGIAGGVLLAMCGNRGSILLLVVFIMFCLFFFVGKKLRKSVYAVVSFVGVSIVLFYQWIVKALGALILVWGMSPRFLNYITSGGFFESEGRDSITQTLLDKISEKPIIGYGLAANHVITESYAHNFVLELWTDFGIIAGSVLIGVVSCIIIKAWMKNKKDVLLCTLLCVGFFKLFISSSFLFEGMFFALLGYCVTLNRKGKLLTDRKG